MSLIQIKAQDRHIARKGDLIGLYGNKKRKFKLLVALDANQAQELFVEPIQKISLNQLNESEYEVYCINLDKTPASFNQTKNEFLRLLESNFNFVHGLTKGQIVKMDGEKILGQPIYHHHALFSDEEKFKIIHKWGEPDATEVVLNLMRAQSLKNVEIREDNILEVACFRFLSLEDSFESKYKHLLRSPDEIIEEARKKIGRTTYDLYSDNCQHFCTLCRFGESKAIEVEWATKAIVIGGSISLACAVGLGLFVSNRNKKKKTCNEPNYNV